MRRLTHEGRELPVYVENIDGEDVILVAERNDKDGGIVTNLIVSDGNGAARNFRSWRGAGIGTKAVVATSEPAWNAKEIYPVDATVAAHGFVWLSNLAGNIGNPPGKAQEKAWRQAVTPITDQDRAAGQAEALATFEKMQPAEIGLRARLAKADDAERSGLIEALHSMGRDQAK